jgi:predicted site-specific integrase-resolvase
VQRVFGIKRQTVYDWVDEAKLTAYYIRGKQMFYRPDIEKEVEKRRTAKSGIVQRL